MNKDKRIESFARLGVAFHNILQTDRDRTSELSAASRNLLAAIHQAEQKNHWFTEDMIRHSLKAWSESLRTDSLRKLCLAVPSEQHHPLRIAIIMAGNIPLVGMHDWMSTLLCGHSALVKLSQKDDVLLPAVNQLLCEIEPQWAGFTDFVDGILPHFDGAIATGSNNSFNYFNYYFSKVPHVLRHNMQSVAILSGQESREELSALCDDLFLYFGLGCRNVSLLLVPEGYDFSTLIEVSQRYANLSSHHAYSSTYDYHKALLLMNGVPFTDGGFWLLKESDATASPVSVVNFCHYNTPSEAIQFLEQHNSEIQCVALGHPFTTTPKPTVQPETMRPVRFGQCQRPELTDFADGVDIIDALLKM